ncbi:MAG TPA: STM3941 family protein [Flavobacteriales bacterium]|nr:STM3941 family protein [Flavobacteriales bacterium]
METLNIHISKGKIKAAKIGLGVLFAVFCLLFALAWINEWSLAHVIGFLDHLFIILALGICTAICAFAFYWVMARASSSKPMLVLEQDGYVDNMGLLKGTKFMFKDIDRFEEKKVTVHRVILVYFKDVDAFLDKQTGFKKKMLRSTFTQMGTPISIPAAGLDYNFDDLLGELNKRLEHAR